MRFSEFLREEEELDLFIEAAIEEGLIGGTLRGIKGFGGNLVSQTGRGALNIAGGLSRTARGLGQIGLGAVQGVTGASDLAGPTLVAGAKDLASGVGGAAAGAAQLAGAVSGLTPTLRGVQAANEKSLFTPMSQRRTRLQKAMGLNSWDPEGDAAKDAAEHFKELKARFSKARAEGDRASMRRIRAEMEKHHPKEYEKIVAKARAMKAAHERKRWRDIGDRVDRLPDTDEFLRRLSTEH